MSDTNSDSKTVLIAEDNDDNRIVYSTMLEHYGYRVVYTKDGSEVQELAGREKPSVILMDISLPGMDGWTATQKLKNDPETSKIPVIAITAHALSEDRKRAEEVGCDGYLSKPVEPRRVLEEVERFISSNGT